MIFLPPTSEKVNYTLRINVYRKKKKTKEVISSMKTRFSKYISKTKQEEVTSSLTGQATCVPPEKKYNWLLRNETSTESTKVSAISN